MEDVLFYQNYSVAGDVIAIAICLLYRIMLRATYVIKRKNLSIFNWGNFLIMVAAFSQIIFHFFVERLSTATVIPIYVLRNITYISIVLTYVMFCLYIRNLVGLTGLRYRLYNFSIWFVFILFLAAELLAPVTRLGFYIADDLSIHQNYYRDPFRYVYVIYGIVMLAMFVIYRRKFIAKIYYCILSSMIISFLLMTFQEQFTQTTYTCVTFTFPIMAVLFLFHHNSYDPDTGVLDARSFNGYIRDMGNKKFSMVCLHLQELNADKIQGVSEQFFRFNEKYFVHSCTFRMRDEKFVMVYEDDKNKDIEQKIQMLLDEFRQTYDKYRIPYRIVVIHSTCDLGRGSDYLAMSDFIDDRTPLNSVHFCDEKDVEDYQERAYILNQLQDIFNQKNLDDERIKVYCQPVWNTRTHSYTSAEALMRMELPECGMVYPDQFIPLAEKYEYIHVLSMIILNKTCQHIRKMEDMGYEIDRISINFSILELRNKNFCEDIVRIIQQNRIPYDKIAVELTESRNEDDFENVKSIMARLHHLGIKFYLDDFGTGYSNFVRIIGLPIDIIKFDRSLTSLASKNKASRFLVGSFSEIFIQSNYQVLFEGVEDDKEEQQCIEMKALYLQGYKYSKPVPMDDLTRFLGKVG